MLGWTSLLFMAFLAGPVCFNDSASPAPCVMDDGKGTVTWPGSCVGNWTFALKEPKLVASFEFPNATNQDQNLTFGFGGCLAHIQLGFSNGRAQFTLSNAEMRKLPLDVTVSVDKASFTKDPFPAVKVTCQPDFVAMGGGSYTIAVEYKADKPEKLVGLETQYQDASLYSPLPHVPVTAEVWFWLAIGGGILGLLILSFFGAWFVLCKTDWVLHKKPPVKEVNPKKYGEREHHEALPSNGSKTDNKPLMPPNKNKTDQVTKKDVQEQKPKNTQVEQSKEQDGKQLQRAEVLLQSQNQAPDPLLAHPLAAPQDQLPPPPPFQPRQHEPDEVTARGSSRRVNPNSDPTTRGVPSLEVESASTHESTKKK